jgi:hypothetical protein
VTTDPFSTEPIVYHLSDDDEERFPVVFPVVVLQWLRGQYPDDPDDFEALCIEVRIDENNRYISAKPHARPFRAPIHALHAL